MRILFISNDLIAGHLAYLLKKEGNKVKLYIHEKERRNNLTNLVNKTLDWESELKWVGKKGLIVFDDIGFGHFQDELREKGYNVFGGSEKGDLLESDRAFGQKIFSQYGINTLPTYNFKTITSTLNFVKKNKDAWVIKQNGTSSKGINFVGHFTDSRDVIDVLNTYRKNNSHESEILTIQKRAVGIEIAVTRMFNGTDWVGPILINIEHKRFFPGDLGPTTSEMGTLGWYDTNENNKLFIETLAKIKPYLQEINYRGIIDINCIVNESGIFPLEVTSRVGSPIAHLQTSLNTSTWSEIMSSVSQGKNIEYNYKKGFGIVVVVAVPPFPYAKKISEHSQIGTHIYFDDSITEREMDNIHFEEVSVHKKNNKHYISDNRGYVLYVTGTGPSPKEAQEQAYSIIKKIHIPKMFYRNDIGDRFLKVDQLKLKKWGYL